MRHNNVQTLSVSLMHLSPPPPNRPRHATPEPGSCVGHRPLAARHTLPDISSGHNPILNTNPSSKTLPTATHSTQPIARRRHPFDPHPYVHWTSTMEARLPVPTHRTFTNDVTEPRQTSPAQRHSAAGLLLPYTSFL